MKQAKGNSHHDRDEHKGKWRIAEPRDLGESGVVGERQPGDRSNRDRPGDREEWQPCP